MNIASVIPGVSFNQGITKILSDLLRKHDKTFCPLESEYQKSADVLQKRFDSTDSVFSCFIEAEEQIVQVNFLYAAYLGFRANLENYRCPAGYSFLDLDYSVFLKEHLMGHSDASRSAENEKERFRSSLPSEYEQCYDDINEYYIALDVVGTKLAHYWGYLYANKLLPLVEPGYIPDYSQTGHYKSMLEMYLGFYPPELDTAFKTTE